MTDLKVVLKQFQEADRALSKAIRENGEQFITTLFQSIFDKYPAVTHLATVGSTPSFNDGDICSHSSEYYSGSWERYTWSSRDPNQKHYDFEERAEVEEFFTGEHPDDRDEDEDEDDEGNENSQDVTTVEILADETGEPLDENQLNNQHLEAKGMLEEHDTIFERIYGTNYIVKARRLADGTIEVENDEYDPGY